MNTWIVIVAGLFIILLLDALIRAIFLLLLAKRLHAKGDYHRRYIEVGSGKKRFVVTLLGASSMYGEGSNVEVPFADALSKQLAKRGHKVIVYNLAVSGHRVADVTAKQVRAMKKSNLVVVYAGTKDCLMLTPTQQYLLALHELAKALQGKTVIWVTIGDPRWLWLLPVWLRWLFYFRARRFTRLLKQVVAAYSTEQWQLVDFFAQGPKETRRRNLKVRQVVSDGIHLSNEGQKLVSEMIKSART